MINTFVMSFHVALPESLFLENWGRPKPRNLRKDLTNALFVRRSLSCHSRHSPSLHDSFPIFPSCPLSLPVEPPVNRTHRPCAGCEDSSSGDAPQAISTIQAAGFLCKVEKYYFGGPSPQIQVNSSHFKIHMFRFNTFPIPLVAARTPLLTGLATLYTRLTDRTFSQVNFHVCPSGPLLP